MGFESQLFPRTDHGFPGEIEFGGSLCFYERPLKASARPGYDGAILLSLAAFAGAGDGPARMGRDASKQLPLSRLTPHLPCPAATISTAFC